MQIRKSILLWCFVFTELSSSAQTTSDNPLKTQQDSVVHESLKKFFQNPCHVGISMAIYHQGKSSFYNYGSTSKDSPSLPSRNSLYEIASLTKTFTGTLLAKAVLDGKMKLDDDIRLYLKESYPNLEYKGKPITLRHLATHQSGLPNSIPDNSQYFKNPNFDSLPFILLQLEKGYDRSMYLKELHNIKLDTFPGAIFFKYSNIGVKVLSFALENVYNSTFTELVKRYITQPLKMHSTSISLSTNDSVRLAKGYSPNGKLMPYSPENSGAAGGLKSTTADMIKYVSWHLDETDPVIQQAHKVMSGDIKTYATGLNWNMVITNEGDRKLWQSGGSFGMSSQVILFPERKFGIILLANDGCFDTQGELEKIGLAVFNDIKH